jgi:hypothetical protein
MAMERPALFDPARHEALDAPDWDATRAHDAIASIVDDVVDRLDPACGWPPHPQDEIVAPATGLKSLYFGASGVLWSLWYLARCGAVALAIQPADLVRRLHADYLAEPDTEAVVPSYFLGEAGILLVDWRLTASRHAEERLAAVVRENIANPTNEALWAAPGTMVAAWHMWTWTGDARWQELFAENVGHLLRTWQRSEHAPCHLWTQDLYGRIVQLLGAGHGFAGNVDPLLRGAALLSDEQQTMLFDRCVETLQATVIEAGACANWRPGVGPPRPGRTTPLVQWCHGAPGIVTGLSHYPLRRSQAMEDLLCRAADLVWEAGPLAKGHGLCHGTAGNGYAFLAMHRRTQDETWLARARAFAMHAIGQCERMGRQYGQGRYTLWTGDPGLAVYLWHCIEGGGGMPGLDVMDRIG